MRRIAPVLLVASFLVACQESEPTRPLEPGDVSSDVWDGAHDGGNDEFFFLPPLVSAPGRNEDFGDSEFNPYLEPFVRVCELTDATPRECTGEPVVDKLPMELQLLEEKYIVVWRTLDDDLDPDKFYRIQVFFADLEDDRGLLGYRDVDPEQRPMRRLSCRDSGFCKFENGSTIPIQVRIERFATCHETTDCQKLTFNLDQDTTFDIQSPEGERILLNIPDQDQDLDVEMGFGLCNEAELARVDDLTDLPTFGPCVSTDILTDWDGVLDPDATATISYCELEDPNFELEDDQGAHLRVHAFHEDGTVESLREKELCDVLELGSRPTNPFLRFASRIRDRVSSWVGVRPLMASSAMLQGGARGGNSLGTLRTEFVIALGAKIDYLDPDDEVRTAEAGSTLPTAAIVTDIEGNPVKDAKVRWNATVSPAGGAAVVPVDPPSGDYSCAAGTDDDVVCTTGLSGIIEVDWILDSEPGVNRLAAGGRGIADPGLNGPRDENYPLGPFDPFTPIAYDEDYGLGWQDDIDSPEDEGADTIPEGTELLFTATGILEEDKVLYGVNSGDDGLSIIDVGTGHVTFIGELDPDYQTFPQLYTTPVAMAVGADEELFVWNNSNIMSEGGEGVSTGVLLTADACTGVGTPVDESAPPQGTLQALAYSPTGGLYGLVGASLYTIDTSTGVKSEVGSLGLSINIYAADFDASETLYGVELIVASDPTPERLVTINTTTGAATVVGTLDQNIGLIGSIVFDPSGTLIGSGLGGPSGSVIFEIDKATGDVTNIRTLTGGTAPQGMGFAPICEGY